MIYLIQHFEADFLWKVSLKILNSGIILKTFTHVVIKFFFYICLTMQATIKELHVRSIRDYFDPFETLSFKKIYSNWLIRTESLILFLL